ncbi:11835_t:CDS:2 [Paraglomus brasilianum]|uniref:Protein arginine methyltransferase NDUFAF7 n=1 Tax=Paraglomus brasilianum TaxID=144538 RepID=A0A9N9BET4_9GLOM|nr:11835_t:CDS:2 [Paraglomus brasilianum]
MLKLCQVRSFLLRPSYQICPAVRSYSIKKEQNTPLTLALRDKIKRSGTISVAEYMNEALTDSLHGYYTKGDMFGVEGDFTTSPEVSQMFGELIGIWFVNQWQNSGKPANIQIIEYGPGRGTLLDDMLRAMASFKDFFGSLKNVHLIEVSPALRKLQHEKLCGGKSSGASSSFEFAGPKFHWHDSIRNIPGVWSMIIAHEFFDALPVHQFKKTKDGWREIMVDIDESDQSTYHFQLVTSSTSTTASNVYTSAPEYERMSVGDTIEISPLSWNNANEIAKYIHDYGGSALIIDYGKDHLQGDTLRAVKKHRFTSILTTPGEVDLTADVDFAYLKSAAAGLVNTHGPIRQRDFLEKFGIQLRLSMLLKNTPKSNHRILISEYERLTSPLLMGSVYKFMCMVPLRSQLPFPF